MLNFGKAVYKDDHQTNSTTMQGWQQPQKVQVGFIRIADALLAAAITLQWANT
jgi:hypothetical protein